MPADPGTVCCFFKIEIKGGISITGNTVVIVFC